MLSAERLLQEAESGDLRPQVNPFAVSPERIAPAQFQAIESALHNRFYQLARPIADACREPQLNMRLQDAGPFFYLVECLACISKPRLNETLLVLLDEFLQMEQRSYDELYLWCIVQLSRLNPQHVDTFWPLAIALDLRFRPEKWKRAEGVSLIEEPYRLSELIFYYYHLYTLRREPDIEQPVDLEEGPGGIVFRRYVPRRAYLSLASCLTRITPLLTGEQRALMVDTMHALSREQQRPAFGDAYGLLFRKERLAIPPRVSGVQ